MKALRRTWRRLRGALSQRRNERELVAELELHIEMQAQDNIRAGMAASEALRAARVKFGSMESAKESYRDQRGLPWIDALQSDVRYALRGWRKNPGFTITGIAAMALGIGATTAIFSVVNAVMLKPLGIPDPDRLVVLTIIGESDTGDKVEATAASPAQFEYWRAQRGILHDVSAFRSGVVNYAGGGTVEQWQSMQVSADAFRCLGMRVLLGRGFVPEGDVPHGPKVAVLGAGIWKRRFASDSRIVGRAILLSGESYVVVGIVPNGPELLEDGPRPDIYLPFQIDPATDDQGQSFDVMGRMNQGVTLEQAKERLRSSTAAFRAKFPNALEPKDAFSAAPLRDVLLKDVRALLAVLAGAVSLVLLIACANVANLLLARAAGRRREIGIRMAIGASRSRMIRQLLTESVLLSLTGGVLGLCLGQSGIRALLAANATDLPLIGDGGAAVALDWRVTGFALAVSMATGILFGLFPAFKACRADLNSSLKDASGRWGTGMRQNKARAALVMSEVSLAVVLLVGSTLLIRTFVALYRVDPGFETRNVLTMRMLLAGPKYAKTRGIADTIRSGVEEIRSLPGVVAAATTCCVPLQGNYTLNFDVVGRPRATGTDTGLAGWATVSPGFFDVFRIPLKRGRTFTNQDDGTSSPVVMISEAMARRYWKGRSPLGDSIVIGKGLGKLYEADPARRIIGIVGDIRDEGLRPAPRPIIYVPATQLPDVESAFFFQGPIAWVVRTQGEPRALVAAIQDRLGRVTALPVSNISSMSEVVSASIGQQKFNMLLMTVFAGCAMLLAAVGIYGLMAYTVEQRRQEIGIRLALGAQSGQVKRMIVFQGMGTALIGLLAGVAAAWALSRLMESLLFGVQPRDPLVFGIVPAALATVALAAVWAPAKRASRVDPVTALRCD